jgi:hypothetical protein
MNTAIDEAGQHGPRGTAGSAVGPARGALAIVLALYALGGLLLAAWHLGDVPRYGDSHEYLQRAAASGRCWWPRCSCI